MINIYMEEGKEKVMIGTKHYINNSTWYGPQYTKDILKQYRIGTKTLH